jgi:hypothetical protein
LEEDSSEKLLFGDIFIARFKDDKLISTSISDYGEFYNLIFNDFDDCLSEEDINDDTEEEDSSDISESDGDYSYAEDDIDDNLDYDNTDY